MVCVFMFHVPINDIQSSAEAVFPVEIQGRIIHLIPIETDTTLSDISLVSKFWAYEIRKIQYQHCNILSIPAAISFFNAILNPLSLTTDIRPGYYVKTLKISFAHNLHVEENTSIQAVWGLLKEALPLMMNLSTFIGLYSQYHYSSILQFSNLPFPLSLVTFFMTPLADEMVRKPLLCH